MSFDPDPTISGPGPGIQPTATIQAQLNSVQTLIANIEAAGGNQSYSHGGRTYTRASLPSLYERETALLRRLSRSNSANNLGYDPIFGRAVIQGTGQGG